MKKFMHLFSVSDKPYSFKRLLITQLTLCFIVGSNLGAFADGRNSSVSINGKTSDQQAAAERITGLVTDEGTGETLIGASIQIKGTNTGTTVDVNGKFTIDVPNNNTVLVVSYAGYTSQEIVVGTRRVLDIKLAKVTNNLQDVVVTGFGLTQKKATLSGAVSQISGDELAHSKATSASGALIGKVGGVNFRQSDGRPGSSPTIRIRNFGGDPMVVIDGLVRSMDAFNNIDFNDIESVNLLKDGSAAIYGFGAENGVIVVVTKKGKKGQKPTFNFDSYYGVQSYTHGSTQPGDIKSYIKGIVQTETYGDGTKSFTRSITPEQYQHYMNGDPGYEGFDWYKYINKSAPQAQAKIAVSGGTENSDYYISASTLHQGVALRDFGDGYDRHNIQTNFNANISKRVRFGMTMNGYWSKNSNTSTATNPTGNGSDDFAFQAEAPFRNLPTFTGPYANNNPLYPQVTSPSDNQYNYGAVNPKLLGTRSTIRRNISITGTLEIDIIAGLKARMLAGYTYSNSQFDVRHLSPQLYAYNSATDTYNALTYGQQRFIDHNYSNTDNSSVEFQVEYKKAIGKHNFGITASERYQMSYSPSIEIVGNQPANNIAYLPNALTYLTGFNDNISNFSPSQGYIVNATYDYAGKYIIEGHGRYDGSNLYDVAHRWGFFPGGSVGYRISQEDFWKKSPVLSFFNDFKIRASYGVIPFNTSNNWLTGYTYSQGTEVLNNTVVTGAQVKGPPSTALTWGKTYHSDVAIDMSLLNSRLSITLDYFNKTRAGIEANKGVTLPALVGFQAGNENVNSDKNRGFEGSASWRDRIGELSYGINANLSYGRSITGFRYNQLFNSDYDRFRGNGVDRLNGASFQYTTIGQFQSWEQIRTYPIDQDGKGNTTQRPGDFIFKDTNGDGYINALDQERVTYQVNGGTPILNFGFGFNLNYKGVDFRVDFTGGSLYTFEQTSSGFNGSTGSAYLREWLPNRNTSQYLFDNSSYYSDIFDRNSPIVVGKFPLILQQNPPPNVNINHNGYQTNITYVKVRTAELGYTLPYSVLKPVGVTNLRVYVSGQNLFWFSNMPGGFDPELQSGSGGGLPTPRVLTAGVQVKF